MTLRTDVPAKWLRLEGLAVLLLSFALYREHGSGWLLFLALFFVPDVTMLGYLRGARVGALVYNLGHTYTGPLLLGAASVVTGNALLTSLALVWTAHVGLDRMLGYGLKLPTGFQDTHLGRIGRAGRPAASDEGVPVAALVIAGVLVPLLAGPLAAQEASAPAPGTRVRATAVTGEAPVAGTLLRADSAGIALDPDGPVPVAEIPWGAIERLDVSAGSHSFRNAVLGLGAGAVAGFVLYRARADGRYENDEWNNAAALIKGAPIGALAGFLIGAMLPSERWRRADARVSPAGIAIEVAF